MMNQNTSILRQGPQQVYDPALLYDTELHLLPEQSYAGMRVGVTGALCGIGGAVTVELLRRGATVVGTYFGEERCIRKAVESLQQSGRECHLQSFDFREVENAERSAEWMSSVVGGLDFLFCVAGVTLRQSFLNTTTEQFVKINNINFLSPMIHMRRAIAVMRENSLDEHSIRGRLFGFSSPHAFGSMGYHSGYAATKAAVHTLMSQIASESRADQWGIVAQSVIPGWVVTERQVAGEMETCPHLSRDEYLDRLREIAKTTAAGTLANPRSFADTLLRIVRHSNVLTANSPLDLTAGQLTSFNNYVLPPASSGEFHTGASSL